MVFFFGAKELAIGLFKVSHVCGKTNIPRLCDRLMCKECKRYLPLRQWLGDLREKESILGAKGDGTRCILTSCSQSSLMSEIKLEARRPWFATIQETAELISCIMSM